MWMKDEQDLHCIYFTFDAPGVPTYVLEQLAEENVAQLTAEAVELPADALPVLKHREDGSVVRLWPPGTPGLKPATKITVDWATFTIEHRYYTIE